MIILTQDKEHIMDCKDVKISKYEPYCLTSNDIILGLYKKRQRCKEILQEIFDEMSSGSETYIMPEK